MKICRYRKDNRFIYGNLVGDTIYPLKGNLGQLEPDDALTPVLLSETRLLAPVEPSKIFALGPGHKNMMLAGATAPERPFLFFKPSTSINHPNGDIVFPKIVDNILYELEIAVVIGKTARSVSPENARDYILGYTCCNDVTAGSLKEDWGKPFSYHWKAFDTFCPLGPVINTEIKQPEGLRMLSRINGEVHADTTVALIYDTAEIISWISHITTLLPGDVISLGAAAQTDLKPGDVCEIEIEEIGILKNRVI